MRGLSDLSSLSKRSVIAEAAVINEAMEVLEEVIITRTIFIERRFTKSPNVSFKWGKIAKLIGQKLDRKNHVMAAWKITFYFITAATVQIEYAYQIRAPSKQRLSILRRDSQRGGLGHQHRHHGGLDQEDEGDSRRDCPGCWLRGRRIERAGHHHISSRSPPAAPFKQWKLTEAVVSRSARPGLATRRPPPSEPQGLRSWSSVRGYPLRVRGPLPHGGPQVWGRETDRGGSGDQPDQKFRVASNETEAKAIAKEFPCSEYVIKAMVLAGGRGKGHFDNGFKGVSTSPRIPMTSLLSAHPWSETSEDEIQFNSS